jgi:NADP-dependent 3-hydroxy acid dehydrogenase YdfG
MKIAENVVLITGATSGIGEACAWKFARQGHDLIIAGRRQERLDRLAEEITGQTNRAVLSLCFDVRDREQCTRAVAGIPANWRSEIRILINSAGLAAGRDPVQTASLDDWDEMVDANVKGLLCMIRLVSPIMIENKAGHIINLGSLAGRDTYPAGAAYCATKFAVGAISRAMRLDLLEHGIRVTNIAPGLVETEFSIVRFKGDVEKAKAVYEGITPLTAADIAESIWWAASQPLHVNIDEIVLTARAQGDARTVVRNKGF